MNDPKGLLLRNVFSNWAAMLVGLAVTFFLSPFLVHSLGKEQYGIWALVFSIIAYTNLLDAGMKQSLARYIPKYYALKDFNKINEIINTSNFIYGITGTLVIIVTLLIAFFFVGFFKVDPANINMMRTALIIIGIDQAITFYFMAGTAIGPFHRYDTSNVIGIVSSLISAAVIVYFLSQGYGLVTLALITLIVDLMRQIARRMYQQHLVPEIEFSRRYIKKSEVRELLGYGVISFFIVVGWMVVFHTDNIIIGMFISTSAVTYYNIAGMLVNYLRMLINAIGVPLVPAISHIEATGDYQAIAGLYSKLAGYLFYLTASICAITLIFGAKFIYLWMGPDFTDTVNVLYILIIPVSIYLPQIVSNSILLGIGKHRALFNILAIEAFANLSISLILVKPLGIYGVAIGTASVQLLMYTYVYPLIFHRIIRGDLKQFYAISLRMIFTGVIFTAPVGLVLRYFNNVSGWTGMALDGIVMLVFVASGFWIGALSPLDRQRFKTKIGFGAIKESASTTPM